MFIKAGLQAFFHVFRHAVAGEGHSGSLAYFPSRPDEINSGPIRQADIAKNYVKLPLAKLFRGRRDGADVSASCPI